MFDPLHKLLRGAGAAVVLLSAGMDLPAADNALAGEARVAMEKATAFMRSIATEGGYVWRYSADLTQRAGEARTTPTQIWVQPPGTTAMGMAFVHAYQATHDPRYLDAAKAAAEALASGQLASGGWDYLVEFDPMLRAQWYRREDIGKVSLAEAAKRRNESTFDDNNTQSALRLLVAVAELAGASDEPRDRRIREARDFGLAKLVAAQRPNGGWPQRWDGISASETDYPVVRARVPANYPREHQKEDYYGHSTLNDETHRDCVMTLLEAGKRLNRPELRAAALKGGDFLLLAQLPEPQPVWAQQYNARMEPAWARAFEPPSVCSKESAGAMDLLLDLYLETGDEKFLEPLPRAIAWFKRSELEPGIWARLYELGTNKPIFGDRDGKIHYAIEELSPERRNGYAWTGSFEVPSVLQRFEQIKEKGREATLAKQRKRAEPSTPKQREARASALAPRVREIVAALDPQGRWLATTRGVDEIRTATFIENMRVLSEYLDAVK